VKAVYGYDQRCEVFGSKGSCSINNNYANSAVLSTGSEIKRDLPLHFFMDRYEDAFQEEMQQFVDAVRMKKPLPCTGLDGRAPVVIAYAAKKSYLENRPVKISEVDVPMPPSLVGWNGQVQY
jgi:myo-inositol 2-dehydrogenase/D-chiro-inositol 1-dehydrogenase